MPKNNKKDFSNETEFIFSNEFIGFTTIPNYIFRCKALSFKAIGIYCSILQFQNAPDHKISIKGLMSIHADGETSVTNGLKELLTNGFLEREQIRVSGKIKGYRYTVHMKPKNTVTLDNTSVAPKRDFPDTVKPDMENRFNKKENTVKKKINKKEKDDDGLKSIINKFQLRWTELTTKRIKLTDKQRVTVSSLIEEHGEEVFFLTLEKINDSKYLQEHIKPSKFLSAETFLKIYNGEYDDYKKPQQSELASKNPHFTSTYSHNWDLEELERIDREMTFKEN